ncbi:glycosyltransferase [Microcella sp.]|uniref:glycosyltransferase n=1 Tax=Microcella sp. TaxID=1913979 RepID=UPI00391ACE8E
MTEPWLWPFSGAYGIAVVGVMGLALLLARRWPLAGRRVALLLVALTTVAYLTWRLVETIPTGSWPSTVAGILLITAEIVGAVQVIATIATGWRRSPPVRSRTLATTGASELPTVDVFITTYDESVSVLEPTLAGAMGMRYPGQFTVYLCDDGSRASIRELAERYGAVHLTRTEHQHAKAGNLNNALSLTTGDLVVTLDADMIPRANFLEETVGYFDDPRMAYVQAPQAFHNEDPFQYNLFSGRSLPNEQDYFMRSMQQGKAAYNAVMYVGSNTVFRRSALEYIGGFATGVITEDMATGMLLQAAGYRSEFVPQVIAAGLAPESFATLLTQRTRWSRGNIQTARKWNPATLPGLSFMQRWLYIDGIIYWHFGILKMVFVIAPLLYLLGGITVVDADVPSVLVMWLPYFVTSMWGMKLISGGRRSALWTHVYETAMAPTVALAVIAEWVGLSNKAFAVTPKGVSSGSLNFRLGIAAPNIALVLLSVLALLNAWWWSADRYSVDALLITSFWTLYNIVGLTMAVLVCLERPRHRRSERTEVQVRATAALWRGDARPARVVDLSSGGARVVVPWPVDGDRSFTLNAPRAQPQLEIVDVGAVPGVVRWASEEPSGLMVGFEFSNPTPTHMIGVMRHITDSPTWVRSDREDAARVWGAASRTLVGATQRVRPWQRSEPRLETRGIAVVSRGDEVERVHLEDLSFGGCRIRVSAGMTLVVGDSLLIDLSESHLDDSTIAAPRTATVRWIENRGARHIAGLKFEPVAASQKVTR